MEKLNGMTPFQQIQLDVMLKIKNDIIHKENCDMSTLDRVLNAHNCYFEHERKESGKVIYDINNQTDVQTCVDNGMGAASIALVWNTWQRDHSEYFLYDTEKSEITMLSWEDFIQMLVDSLFVVLAAVLKRPFIFDSYRDLYVRYIMPLAIDQLS